MLSDLQLQQIMPHLLATKRQQYLPYLNAAMDAFGIDTMLRTAAFIAQIAHESGEFRWMEEIWGPTAAQKRYEPPGDLAARLGNTQPGDGLRFKGRGPIQITGRANYQKYGTLLATDLVGNPPLAAAPEVAFRTAALYWKSNGLNELADAEQFVLITKRINGGTNGLEDRQKYYATAKAVLANGFVAAAPAPATRGARRAPVARKYDDVAPLMRGSEWHGEPAPKPTGAPAKCAAAPKANGHKSAAPRAAAKTVATKKVAAKKKAASAKRAAARAA